ncbi:unnamed protein product (mitochondrion) [Plasmodiophora brassicae]|uniref:Plasma membrane ATPase n=1 Tax=Plasmodiophora brassicae TaxID=37360 RepID=A0A0G4J3Y2_PLABS|nr:hypothetical protein PBRA_002354 [Plasmodiophora brassicae]SPQ93718.1 unnamed protein product [Plasmodiophora brassicae]
MEVVVVGSKFSDDDDVGPASAKTLLRATHSDAGIVERSAEGDEHEALVPDEDEVHATFHSARTDKHRSSMMGDEGTAPPIPFSSGLTSAQAAEYLRRYGRNELVEKVKPMWKLFLEQFTAPMPIGIWIAIVVEASLQEWADAVILFILQCINGTVGFLEARKAGNAVAALKATLKPVAQVKRDGVWQTIHAALLVPGDCVTLSSGTAVPADCVVNSGIVHVDQSSLTGESLPVRMGKGMTVRMGSTVARGEVEATVFLTGMQTFYGKTAALLQAGVDELGELQKLLLRVVLVLLGASTVLCGITLLYLLLNGENVTESLGFVVVLMVASIPIAMEVVVTATLALGSRELAAESAIVACLSAIERLSGITVLCSDKTGTLTLNKMVIQNECPTYLPGVTRADVLLHASLATKWKEPPKDALDTMILGVTDFGRCNQFEQIDYTPFDPSLKRTEAVVRDPTGRTYRVAKGAPHVLLELCQNRKRFEAPVENAVLDLAARGVRSLAVARTEPDGQWAIMGILSFLDPPRPDSKATIKKANEYGVVVKMITGDHQLVAVETSKALGLGQADIMQCTLGKLPTIDLSGGHLSVPDTLGRDYAPLVMSKDGFSQALPEHKYVIVEALKQSGAIVGMTGDGVNDAPALKVASVGIAVHGATDAARAAADIILTEPGLGAIVEAIIIARRIFARMHSFLVYRIAATIQLLTFFFIGVLFVHPAAYDPSFPPFWKMPVIALIVITVLNDGTIVSIAYDRVTASKQPESWNLMKLWGMAFTLGSVACASSLVLLHLSLNSVSSGSMFHMLGLPPMTYGSVVTSIYLKVSLSDFLTIFAARTGAAPCYSSRPSIALLAAAFFAVLMSTILSLTWPFDQGAEPVHFKNVIFIWIYCLVWFIIQDACKVGAFRLADRLSKHPVISTFARRYSSFIELSSLSMQPLIDEDSETEIAIQTTS